MFRHLWTLSGKALNEDRIKCRGEKALQCVSALSSGDTCKITRCGLVVAGSRSASLFLLAFFLLLFRSRLSPAGVTSWANNGVALRGECDLWMFIESEMKRPGVGGNHLAREKLNIRLVTGNSYDCISCNVACGFSSTHLRRGYADIRMCSLARLDKFIFRCEFIESFKSISSIHRNSRRTSGPATARLPAPESASEERSAHHSRSQLRRPYVRPLCASRAETRVTHRCRFGITIVQSNASAF